MSESEILRLEIDARPAEEGGRRYARTLDDIQRASGKAASSTDDLDSRFRGLASGALGVAAIATARLTKGMSGISGIARGLALDLTDLTARGVLGVAAAMRTMADGMRDANGELTAVGRATEITATGLEKVAQVVITVSNVILGMKVAAAAAAAGLLVLSHRAASQFAPAWNRVLVSVGDGVPAMEELRSEVSLLAGELGVDGVEAANTFYEILGSMPQLLAEPNKALEILRVSLEAGSTGFTGSAEAAKATAAVLTAFSLDAEEARRVSDALFKAQGLGATTFGEIAAAIGNVSGLTAALGGEFEDLLGIIATLTPTGISTSEVVTQIGGAISNIIKPSVDAQEAAKELGIEFNAAALEAQGLNQFLTNIIRETDGQADILARLFGGRQALALMVSLVDKTAELDKWTQQIKDSAGATTEAVDAMNDSWERQKEIMDNRLSASLRALGSNFEGFGVTALEAINAVLGALNDLDAALAGGPVGFGQRAGEATRGFLGNRVDEITGWWDQAFGGGGRGGPISVLPGVSNRPPPVVINGNSIALGFGEMLRAQEAIRSADPIARPLAPIDLEAQERAAKELADRLKHLDETIAKAPVFNPASWGTFGIGGNLGLTRQDQEAFRQQSLLEKWARENFADAGGTLAKVNVARPERGKPDIDPEKAADATRAIAEGVNGLVDLGDAAGILSDNTRRAVSGVTSLVASLDSFQGASGMLGKIGAGIGIAGAAAGILSSLFDNSAEQERNRILAENNQALDRLRESFETFGTRGDFVRGLDVIDQIQGAGGSLAQIDEMSKHFDFLSRLAGEFGIQLDGNWLPGIAALEEALRDVTKRAFEFADTLDGARAKQSASNEIFDVTDPAAIAQGQLGILQKFAPGLFGGLGNLDLTQQGDREILDAVIRDVFTQYANGTLDKSLLDKFGSGDDFLDVLLGTEGSLDRLAESSEKAAAAMEELTNIPTGFKVDLARFRAIAGETSVPGLSPTTPSDTSPWGPGGSGGGVTRPGSRPPDMGDSGTGRPRQHPSGSTTILHVGGVHVTEAETPRETAHAVAREFVRKLGAVGGEEGRRLALTISAAMEV